MTCSHLLTQVTEAMKQAQLTQEKALIEQREALAIENLKRIQETILEQQKLKEQELQDQLQLLMAQKYHHTSPTSFLMFYVGKQLSLNCKMILMPNLPTKFKN